MEKEELKEKYLKCTELANSLASEIYKIENAKVLSKESSLIVSEFSQKATEAFYYFMNLYLKLK